MKEVSSIRAKARRPHWTALRAAAASLCLAILLAGGAPSAAQGFDVPAPMGILTEAETGQVLWAKDAGRRHPPASLTKLMQMLLVMEALEARRLSLTDRVTASRRAASFGGSSMWVREGEQFSVDDLLKAVAVASANDASVMLAEFLSGTEEDFVAAMNRRVAELGLRDTRFVNSTGLPAPRGQEGNYSTAADLAVLARELLKHPRILLYTSLRRWEIRNGQNRFENTNRLLDRYEGADGLKTGHTAEAGWCLAATARRGGMRLIAVILDAGSDAARVAQAAALLDYGFTHFALVPVVRRGGRVATFDLPRAGRPVVAVAGRDVTVVAERGKRPAAKVVFTRRKGLKPPISTGQVVGEVRLRLADGTLTPPVPAVAQREVKRVNPVVAFLLMVGRWLLHVVTLGRR
ncbi:MAG: D-alanyl-D-alanine carboxypeptidase family protein [Bacillota bacterium]|nr:D-alanyl-D-alanine carboxypeptidase family protein [Bacillota bacterium]